MNIEELEILERVGDTIDAFFDARDNEAQVAVDVLGDALKEYAVKLRTLANKETKKHRSLGVKDA